MIGWIAAGAAVVFVVFLLSRGRTYRRLFADDHFIEVARGLAGVKTAAFARVIESESDLPRTPDDPRALVSSARVAVVYTVRRHESQFVHHCSVSVAGGYTAHAVGATFVLFATKILGLPVEKLRFEIGEPTVHHAEVVLDAVEHEQLANRPALEVSNANVSEEHRAAFDAGHRVEWRRSLGAGERHESAP